MRSLFLHFIDSTHDFCRYCGLVYAEVSVVQPASQEDDSAHARAQRTIIGGEME